MNSITNNNDIGITDFFKYLNQVTNMTITSIEVKPIMIKKDMYITGFRRIGISIIEAHVKHIKQLTFKINGHTTENTTLQTLKENPETEMWLDINLLNLEIVRTAFNELRNYYFQLKCFEIAQIQYKLKTEINNLCSQEEIIIYDNKRIACKELIAKRKLCSMFKSHFIHWGEKINNNKTQYNTIYSEEEIAEMP